MEVGCLALQETWVTKFDRVGGSQIQIAGWIMYATVLWVIKSALCAFYFRLTVSST